MYRLYVFDISYFSGKMEAYLRYKGVPFTRVEPSWGELRRVIYPNTGWMKLPVVQTPDGRWLQDSTPMIRWFEAAHPEHPVLPEDPVHAFLSDLLEDYADEWLWRPALYYRWAFAKDRALYGRRFVEDFLYDFPLPRPLTQRIAIMRQQWTYLRGDGITRHTRAHVESIYLDTLDHLQAILSSSSFLMGGRPTVADFGFFASMFRHFSLDPTPSRIMRERAPAVYAWVARLWDAKGAQLAQAPLSAPPGAVPARLGAAPRRGRPSVPAVPHRQRRGVAGGPTPLRPRGGRRHLPAPPRGPVPGLVPRAAATPLSGPGPRHAGPPAPTPGGPRRLGPALGGGGGALGLRRPGRGAGGAAAGPALGLRAAARVPLRHRLEPGLRGPPGVTRAGAS
jgi:glutathione S-transferase